MAANAPLVRPILSPGRASARLDRARVVRLLERPLARPHYLPHLRVSWLFLARAPLLRCFSSPTILKIIRELRFFRLLANNRLHTVGGLPSGENGGAASNAYAFQLAQ